MGLYISYRYRDKRRFQSKVATFSHPRVFCAPAEGVTLGIGYRRWGQKNRMMGYQTEQKVWRFLQPPGYNPPTWQTDSVEWSRVGDSKDSAYAQRRAVKTRMTICTIESTQKYWHWTHGQKFYMKIARSACWCMLMRDRKRADKKNCTDSGEYRKLVRSYVKGSRHRMRW